MSGAIGVEQVIKLPTILAGRRSNARHFQEVMKPLEGKIRIQRETGSSSWFGFSMIVNPDFLSKKNLLDVLGPLGVDTRPIVGGNFVRNPVMKYLNHYEIPDLNNADIVHDHGLFIGNHHFDIRDKLSQIAEALGEI